MAFSAVAKPPYSARERWQAAYRDWRRGRRILESWQHPADLALDTLRMFGPAFGRAFSAPFDRDIAAAAAPWWAVTGKTCEGAYLPKGATNYAASKVNLVSPGTHDAADGAAYPTWDAATGWTCNGSTQYLISGIVPGATTTVLIRFSDATTVGYKAIFGMQDDTLLTSFGFFPAFSGASAYGWAYIGNVQAKYSTGVAAIAAGACYKNGVADGTVSASWPAGSTLELYIGAQNANGSAAAFCAGKVQAFVVYSDVLTAGEIATVSAAMAAL